MTFEIFVYRAQMFAVKWQGRKPGKFLDNLAIAAGAMITQFLMAMCFAKILAEGEKQCRLKKQKSVRTAKPK
jgi:hypothetical protein